MKKDGLDLKNALKEILMADANNTIVVKNVLKRSVVSMGEIKLLPCPFCGEVEEVELIKCNGSWSVICFRCDISSNYYKKPQQAIKNWNTRKPMERIVERLEEARQKYQRLIKEQGEKEDEAMNIHFRGMINIVKEEGGMDG